MNVLMYLPSTTFNECFHPRDLNRLQIQHNVIVPSPGIDLAQFWTQHAITADEFLSRLERVGRVRGPDKDDEEAAGPSPRRATRAV